MSQENVEALKRGAEAYNRRDIEPLVELFHPEAEWYPFTAQVEGNEAYHGHEGLRQWFANTNATFEESRGNHRRDSRRGRHRSRARPSSRPVQKRRHAG